jgi:hypothetical protein
MRLMSVGFGMAMLLASSAAFAAPGAGGGDTSKGDTGGKGGLGPENSLQSGAQAGTETTGPSVDLSLANTANKSSPDTINGAKVEQKAWEVSATWETHRLLEQDYVANTTSKTFNVLFLAVRYSLTDNDVLTLSDGAQQVFLADPGEPGIRLFDLSLSYTHIFQLPAKFRLSTTASVTAPIGYYSQLMSNITTPSLSVGLSRRFGDLTASVSVRGTYFWDQYSSENTIGSGTGTATGTGNQDEGAGAQNLQWAVGLSASVEYQMPFHRPLSVGGSVYDGYQGFYALGNQAPYDAGNYGYGAGVSPGATTNPLIDNNPWQQSYGEEIYIRYSLPDLSGFKSDLLVALANGDPSLGYPAVLNGTGNVTPYVLGYESAEAYFAFSGRY